MPGDTARYADGKNMGWQLISFNDSDEQLSDTFPVSREQFIRVRDLFDYGDDEWFANSYPVTTNTGRNSSRYWPAHLPSLASPTSSMGMRRTCSCVAGLERCGVPPDPELSRMAAAGTRPPLSAGLVGAGGRKVGEEQRLRRTAQQRGS
jgi:hypothetical protein